MSLSTRGGALLVLAVALPSASIAQQNRTFAAVDGAYSFQYPSNFELDRQFADGSGDVTGVKAFFSGQWRCGHHAEIRAAPAVGAEGR